MSPLELGARLLMGASFLLLVLLLMPLAFITWISTSVDNFPNP